MSDTIKNYIDFISENKTERECVKSTIRLAEKAGYRNIEDYETLRAGDKVYMPVYGKSIVLFELGTNPIEEGMNILCAHIDSPRLDLKMKPLMEMENVQKGLEKSIPSRYGDLILKNREAIEKGMERVKSISDNI